MSERKDARLRSQLELARAARRDAEELLQRARIEIHQVLDEQLQVIRAEIARGDQQIEESRAAGQFLLAGQLEKAQKERRRRAAVLREIQRRIIDAGLTRPKSKSKSTDKAAGRSQG